MSNHYVKHSQTLFKFYRVRTIMINNNTACLEHLTRNAALLTCKQMCLRVAYFFSAIIAPAFRALDNFAVQSIVSTARVIYGCMIYWRKRWICLFSSNLVCCFLGLYEYIILQNSYTILLNRFATDGTHLCHLGFWLLEFLLVYLFF